MSYFATCNGLQVVSGSLMIPLVGAWTADLHLAGSTPVTGTVPVVIGNLTLRGTVYRGDVFGGQTRVRLIGGYGGWRNSIGQQAYGSSSGVKASTVLIDAATTCGERVSVANTNIGNAYVRLAGTASDVLWDFVKQGFIESWHVDQNGVTQTTPWPATTVQTPFTVTDQRPDEGLVVIATEDYASWLPGASFSAPQLDGTFTNGGVVYSFSNDGLFRLEVLTGPVDRLLGPIEAFIARQVAPTRYYGRYRYIISNPSTTTIDGTPYDTSIGLPDITSAPLTSDAISTYSPPDGGEAHIMFLDGVPTQPICVWTAGTASVVNLDGGANPVARLGDQVQVFLPPSLPLVGTVSGAPFVGVATVVNPLSGAIVQGSASVNSA